MSLSSVGNPAWETIRGERFAMLYGPTLVAILVTHDVLDEIERAPPGVGGVLHASISIAMHWSRRRVRSTSAGNWRKAEP